MGHDFLFMIFFVDDDDEQFWLIFGGMFKHLSYEDSNASGTCH